MTPVRHILAALALASSLCAADPLLPTDLAAFGFQGRKEFGLRELVPVTGQAFPQAWRFTIASKPDQDWGVNSLCDVDKPLAKNDVLALSFWMRSVPQADVKPSVRIQHQRGTAPFVRLLDHTFQPTAAWAEYRIAYKVPADYVAKETRVAFFFGAVAPQVIEFAQVTCVNHGQVDPATLGIPVWAPQNGK